MSVTIGGLEISSMNLVKQWGLSPASASLTAVGSGGIAEGDEVTLTVGGFSFSGIVNDAVNSVDDGGSVWRIGLVDFRKRLEDDYVFGFFNREVIFEDDITTPGIDRKRYFQHLYPDDWSTYTVRWTDRPHTAKEIITMVLTSPTVDHTWTARDHSRLSMRPTFIDCEGGKRLGVILQEILDQCGLVLGIEGDSELLFAELGAADIPSFPVNSRDRTLGQSLGEGPTKVFVTGDRNQYQLSNGMLEPDWKEGWQQWWGELQWLEKVQEWFDVSVETKADRALLAAKARSVTVREVVEASGDPELADYGRWGEVSRMEIPAWLYLQSIVFKAYRIPRHTVIGNTPLRSAELRQGLLAAVTYDAKTGYHKLLEPYDFYPDTKAFITVQGQPLDVWDPARSGEFDPEVLRSARTRWQANNRFEIDQANYVVIFQDAVFVDAEGDGALIVFPNEHVDEIDDDLRYLAVPNAAAEISAAPVRVTMVFGAERYRYAKGSGRRRALLQQPGLSKQIVDGSELKYADNETADEKAEELAEFAIRSGGSILSGGYTRVGEAGTTLTPAISSVNLTLDFSGGLQEVVAFSTERNVLTWDSERELERRQKSVELFPGQQRLTEEVELLKRTAKHLAAVGTGEQHRYYQDLGDVIMRPVTNREPNPTLVRVEDSETYQAGDVIWRSEAGVVGSEGGQFMGVVIAENCTGSQYPLARQGVVPVRVTGPFEAGDQVGCPEPDESSAGGVIPAEAGGERVVGRVMASYGAAQTILAPVQLGSPGNAQVQQLTIRSDGEGGVRIFFAKAYGLGWTDVINGLEDGEWQPFAVEQGLTKFYLRVVFRPEIQRRIIGDGDEGFTQIWVLASGGDAEEVSIVTETGDSEPEDTDPIVDHESGEIEEGVYHHELGRVTREGSAVYARNWLYGPLEINYCAPNLLRVLETTLRDS